MQIEKIVNKKQIYWKNKLFMLGIFTVVICLYLIAYHWKIEVREIVLFETLSASIEVFVALMALLGMVGVFKLELLNNKKDRLSQLIQELIFSHYGGNRRSNVFPEEILKEAKETIKQNGSRKGSTINRLKKLTLDMENTLDDIDNIKLHILDFVIFSSIMIIISLVFLMTTPIISEFYFGASVLFIVVVMSIVTLLSMIGLIQSIL